MPEFALLMPQLCHRVRPASGSDPIRQWLPGDTFMSVVRAARHRDRQDRQEISPVPPDSDREIASLREENRQLRELVIQLSSMVIRKTVERR